MNELFEFLDILVYRVFCALFLLLLAMLVNMVVQSADDVFNAEREVRSKKEEPCSENDSPS